MTPIEEIARNVGRYVMRHFVEPWGKDLVRYYRAEVVTPAENGVIVVKRPFDTVQRALPYTDAAASLQAGQQCIIFVLGDMSNAVVMADGNLKRIGSGGGGGEETQVRTATITAPGTSASVSYSGGILTDVYAESGGERVLTDVSNNGTAITFSVASAPTTPITCTVVYTTNA